MSSIQDNSQDLDYEPPQVIKRGRGRPRGSGRGRGRPPKNVIYTRPVEPQQPEEPATLFENVKIGKFALQLLLDDWIESYRQDREAATLELLQFFLRSSGCLGKITPAMRESMDNTQIIRQMVEEFDEECGADYPLVMTGPQWKKFRVNFCEFVHVLIKQCQYSIIYDQYLMESLISWLISLSDSQVRAFRHTATLAAMKLMTALVDVALLLSINLDNTQRQYENERTKSRDRRASERLDSLISKRQEIDENIKDINLMLSYLFKSMFVHRYRDVVPEIRAICIYEIGVWMKRFPNHFLDDSYLKYVGWTLHDKVSDVRLKCLQSLLPLYETEEIARKMELFTNKFKDRIVAMSLDKDSEVAVQAIRLLIQIHKHHRDVLSDKDCEHLYEIVYVTNRGMAQAAGEFLNERLFQVNDSLDIRSKRGKKRSAHTPLIRDLVQFFIESEFHEHASYLVDSLIDSHPMMKDWECMTDLLIEEAGPDEEPLDDKQETSLIEIMICCIRQSVSNEPPICREAGSRRQLSNKEMRLSQDEKNRITEHFIHTLPMLLDIFKTDQDKVANLMMIPQYFELGLLTQNAAHLERLLKLMNDIVDIHSDTEVLEACAKSYEYLYDEDYSFSRNVWLSKSSLIDMLVSKYKETSENFALNPNSQPDNELASLIIKKLSVFYSSHDLTGWSIWTDLFDRWIRPVAQDNIPVPVQATRYAIVACHQGLIWEMHLLNEGKEQNVDEKNLLEKANDLIGDLRNILAYRHCDDLREQAYVSLCDLLIVFSPCLKKSKFPSLYYHAERPLIQELELFLLEKVFIEDYSPDDDEMQSNSKLETLHKKRKFLSGYSKLIMYNIIPIIYSVVVIKNYVRVSFCHIALFLFLSSVINLSL